MVMVAMMVFLTRGQLKRPGTLALFVDTVSLEEGIGDYRAVLWKLDEGECWWSAKRLSFPDLVGNEWLARAFFLHEAAHAIAGEATRDVPHGSEWRKVLDRLFTRHLHDITPGFRSLLLEWVVDGLVPTGI